MTWIALVIAVIMLGVFLLSTVRSYERESAGAALGKVEELTETIALLEERIQNLESIAAAESGGILDDIEAVQGQVRQKRTKI